MKSRLIGYRVFRISLGLVGLFLCIRLGIGSVQFGTSRLFSTVAIVQAGVEAADTAVRLNPNDPEAHYTRALALVNSQRLPDAVAELRQAIRLRPHHYYQWLDLGLTLQRLGNETEAAAALRESIQLAPSFAQPHWQLGNLLFRQGRYQDAFVELRLGAKNSPNLFGAMLDLAWVASDGDVRGFEDLIQPAGVRSHLEIARFLAKQCKGADSVSHIQQAGQPQDEQGRTFMRETILALLHEDKFSEAFNVWVISHPASAAAKGQILNGDFVDSISENDPGFGWQLRKIPNVAVGVDASGPTPKSQSLVIDFSGESPPGGQIFYQLVLVSPNTHYSMGFSAKTEQLVTGGMPVIVVSDPDSHALKTLSQSKAISSETGEWTSYTADFETSATTSAVAIGLQRMPCSENTCPAFGRLWLSMFRLDKN